MRSARLMRVLISEINEIGEINESFDQTRVLIGEIDEGFDRQDLQPLPDSSVTGCSSTGKAKMCWDEEVQQDGGMDELLAVLGYQVRASDTAEVAQKLELLEDLMGNAQGDGLSHLATETVMGNAQGDYNPSNLNAREREVTMRDVGFFFFFFYGSGLDNIHTLPE